MVIRAGGRRWIVESTPRENGTGREALPAPFVDLTFRREEEGEECVELGWVPRPNRITPELARRLFELAGRRIWLDSRTGRRYEVEIVVAGPDESGGDLGVRFTHGDETPVEAPYPLSRPLGLASGAELEAMVDVARECHDRTTARAVVT